MKAPKKIYITKNLLGELRNGWDALPSDAFTNIEYTRTDAFIEKAAEWLNNFYNEDTHSYLIDEDIKKFINYMKGE